MNLPPAPRRAWSRLGRRTAGLQTPLLGLHRDQRGEISSQAVLTALMVGLAVTVAGIIAAVVLDWVNSIPGPGS